MNTGLKTTVARWGGVVIGLVCTLINVAAHNFAAVVMALAFTISQATIGILLGRLADDR